MTPILAYELAAGDTWESACGQQRRTICEVAGDQRQSAVESWTVWAVAWNAAPVGLRVDPPPDEPSPEACPTCGRVLGPSIPA